VTPPAWRDAAAAVAVIGPVLMAAFAARPLPVPSGSAYGWEWFDYTSFGGIIVAALWTAAGLGAWQWPAAIISASVLCFAVGLTCVSRYERRRRGGAAGVPE